MSDAPWLQRAIDGDSGAHQHLVASHGPVLRRYLRRRMGSRLLRSVSVADLVQEVFLRVFRAMPSMPADASERLLRSWIYRHADWVLANHGNEARDHRGESAAAANGSEVAGAGSSTGRVTHADQVAWLQELLARLDPPYRNVVRLRLQGLEFGVIGARLGMAEEAVRQRWSRIVKGLQARHGGPPAPDG